MAIKLGNIKRGDTLRFSITAKDKITSELITGLADKMLCQARYGYDEDLLFAMTITETETGKYLFTTDYDTQLLRPNKSLLFDIEYIDDEYTTVSTETFYIDIVGDISYGS